MSQQTSLRPAEIFLAGQLEDVDWQKVSSFFVNRISQEFFSMFQFQYNYVIVHTQDTSFYENHISFVI